MMLFLGSCIVNFFPNSGELLQHLECGGPPPLLLCPASLNRVLEAAISASLVGSADPMAEHLTFLLRDTQLKSVGIPGREISLSCASRKVLYTWNWN
jgi:hypothetical protein